MRKKVLTSLFATLLLVGVPTVSFASGDSLTSLKNQIKALNAKISSLTSSNNNLAAQNKKLTAQVNSLTAQNNTLKSNLNSIISQTNGTIYIDGAKERNADFVSYKGKQYVALDGIVPALTGYDTNYRYNTGLNALYVGVLPANGSIQLQNLNYYSADSDNIYFNGWEDGSSFVVNSHQLLFGIGVPKKVDSQNEYSINYKLSGKYSKLSFKVGLDDNGIGSGDTGSIIVYGDGKVLYTSGTLETQNDPIPATIDVSGVQMLKVVFKKDN
ncbi:NPCBM/NEW2 domain-containing protein [Bacillus sp. BRMEA1]|uniref:NPCBM/NEW2 domain-containing protein n=1 Tax=Neobacillus endophyticus TaxID=2738405 RepID=UPI001565FCDD|nr:NPCBM/NEW2 domain-containing protein [Neobacillus endophyticus]NRD81069.1 NPCBM/NEW2 domain-containing protein [Neobacillus endophyticus]